MNVIETLDTCIYFSLQIDVCAISAPGKPYHCSMSTSGISIPQTQDTFLLHDVIYNYDDKILATFQNIYGNIFNFLLLC